MLASIENRKVKDGDRVWAFWAEGNEGDADALHGEYIAGRGVLAMFRAAIAKDGDAELVGIQVPHEDAEDDDEYDIYDADGFYWTREDALAVNPSDELLTNGVVVYQLL